MAGQTPICDFGWRAPDFKLPGVDGKRYALSDVRGRNATLIMFLCNHCPYVKAVVDRLNRDARDLQAIGIGVAAICSNDADAYPEDSFDNMRRFAAKNGFPFPYLHDASQSVARAYGAICTPDFFGFDKDLGLQYRGRIDAGGMRTPAPGAKRELFEAMKQVAESGKGPEDQIPSIGCTIKWKRTT